MPEKTLYSQPGQQLSLSFVEPDFYDADLLDQPAPVYRFDDRGQRYYYTLDDDLLPQWHGSVTSIKDKVLGKPQGVVDKRVSMGDAAFFEYVKNRQQFGTFMHIQWGRVAIDGEYEFGEGGELLQERIDNFAESNGVLYTSPRYGKLGWFDEAWLGVQAWAQFLDDYSVKPLAVEIGLAHPDGFSNTIDLICEMDAKKYNKTPKKKRKRIKAIVDPKSGYIYKDHAIQLAFNGRSVKNHYPDLHKDIKRYYNFSPKEWWKAPSYELRNQTDHVKAETKLLDHYLSIWRSKFQNKPSDVKIPTGNMVVGSDISQNYRVIPVDQFVQQKHKEL